jgi:DNA-binding MarR family transcriptional regulator
LKPKRDYHENAGRQNPVLNLFLLTQKPFFSTISYAKEFDMTKYNDCIIFLLAKADQKAHSNFKKHLLPHRLTPVQHLILETLWKEEGLSPGEIGKRLVLDRPTLSGVLNRMTEKGWVIKKSDDDDKRVSRIYLKSKAKRLKPLLLKKRKLANKEVLSGLNREEKVLLKRLLRDVKG